VKKILQRLERLVFGVVIHDRTYKAFQSIKMSACAIGEI
jgi:hypothetical protein